MPLAKRSKLYLGVTPGSQLGPLLAYASKQPQTSERPKYGYR